MTTVTVHCDRCGGRIDRDRTRLVMDCGTAPARWTLDPVSGRPTIDVCPPCVEALALWLNVAAHRAHDGGTRA